MIQAIDVTDIYSGRTADVYVRCGQVHVLLPFVGWTGAHFECRSARGTVFFILRTQSLLFVCGQMTVPARAR